MSPRQLIILCAVLAVLVGAYFLLPGGPGRRGGERGAGLKTGEPIFEGFDPESAREIVIEQKDSEIRLRRVEGTKWVLASHDNRLAQWTRIEKLLQALQSVAYVQPRLGESKLFELDPDHRSRLTVDGENGRPVLALDIGRAPQFDRCFITRGSETEVLEVDRNFDELAGHQLVKERRILKPEYWYDLALLRFKANEVIEIVLNNREDKPIRARLCVAGKGPLKPGEPIPQPKPAARTGEGGEEEEPKETIKLEWRLVEPEDCLANENTIKGIASTAAWLNAEGYADGLPSEAVGLESPRATTKVVLADGTSHTLKFGQVGEDYAILQVEGRKDIFKIAPFVRVALTPGLEKLRKRADDPLELPPDTALPLPTPTPEGTKTGAAQKAPPKIDEKTRPEAIPPIPEHEQKPDYVRPD
ncbi:MAG: DUF4340 domain-containing protein [Planctomycetota bacterium]|nr:DUF4340 domain-containing protein [Planctomycetota bacterium]